MKHVRTRIVELMARKQEKTRKIVDVATIMENTGLSRPTVTNWVKGRVRRFDEDTIVRFCEYFDCDVGDLMTLAEDN